MEFNWREVTADAFEAIPYENSSFVLSAKRQAEGKWMALIDDEPLETENPLRSLSDAVKAAEDAYNSYYVDFEEPSDVF